MAFGKRIKRIRQLKGLTQRELGERIGFSGKAADIRIAQYESETRKPKDKIAEAMAFRLDVPTLALDVPDIDSDYGIIHTLFALEDENGFMIDEINGITCIRLDINNSSSRSLSSMFNKWLNKRQMLENGEITREEYDQSRYAYPDSAAMENRKSLDALREKEKAKTETE